MAKQQPPILYVIVLVALVAVIFVAGNDILFTIATGFAGSTLLLLTQQVAQNGSFRHYWQAPILHRGEPYRLSMSYLILVGNGDDILLVRGRRFDQFQPVGGVYKFFPEASSELSRCDYEPDQLVTADESSQNDLRLIVRGKHVLRFLRWFDSSRDREQGPWREFYEELVAPDILPLEEFGSAQFRYLGRRYNPVRRTPYAHMMREVLVADIFELVPSERQSKALMALRHEDRPDVLWLGKAAARRRGAGEHSDPVPAIGAHTTWLLDLSALR